MPEVEKIEEKEKGKKSPIFKGDLRKIFNFIKKIRLPKYRFNPLKPEPKKETLSETGDLLSEAERKLKFGDLDGAEKLYLRLAVVSPQDAAIYASLGRIYLERLNYKDAISSFKAAINRDQKNGFYYYDLAGALYKNEKYKEAIVCFEKSIQINNRIPNRHFGLGLALMKIGENEQAAESFRKAIFIEPNNERYQKFLKKTSRRLSSVARLGKAEP
jgi:tetratricopeptide (TPR) repeat protein